MAPDASVVVLRPRSHAAPRISLFGEASARSASAEAPALWMGESPESYGALAARVVALEAQLAQAGLEAGQRIVIGLERGPALVAAVLAALRSRVVFTLVDPEHPDPETRRIVDELRPQLGWVDLAGDAALPEGLRRLWAHRTAVPRRATRETGLARESRRQRGPRSPVEGRGRPLRRRGLASPIAYVSFEAVRDGRPLGVAISRAALWGRLEDAVETFGLEAKDRGLAWSAPSSTAGLLEMLLPLWVGGSLELVEPEGADLSRVASRLDSAPVTLVQGSAARLRRLSDAGWEGSGQPMVLVDGAVPDRPTAQRLVERGASVWSLQGVPECTGWSFFRRLRTDESAADRKRLGRAFPRTRWAALDPAGRSVEEGELLIAGTEVGEGYWNRPFETVRRFVPHSSLGRSFRTGRRVRVLADGQLALAGERSAVKEVPNLRRAASE